MPRLSNRHLVVGADLRHAVAQVARYRRAQLGFPITGDPDAALDEYPFAILASVMLDKRIS